MMSPSDSRLRNIITSVAIFVVGFVVLYYTGVLLGHGLVLNNTISYNWFYVYAAVVALVVGYYAYKAFVNLEQDSNKQH
jgi:divalent metal cation (Fe/Co/Zn/Cd) transporter